MKPNLETINSRKVFFSIDNMLKCVTGNIGSGKSTYIQNCKNFEGFIKVEENIEEWG